MEVRSDRLAIFDLDGTLLNSWGRHLAAVRQVARKYGLPRVSEETLRRTLGMGGEEFWRETVGNCRSSYAHDMWAFYAQAPASLTSLYEGIPEALATLTQNGVRLVLLSNRSGGVGRAEVTRHGLDRYFERMYFIEDLPAPKPHPEVLTCILAEMGRPEDKLLPKDKLLPEAKLLLVGDSDVDVYFGRNTSVPVVTVTWGPLERTRLMAAQPAILCGSPRDLAGMCLEILNGSAREMTT